MWEGEEEIRSMLQGEGVLNFIIVRLEIIALSQK